MKTCGYCGNEYDDKEAKCPQCGATLLKHTKGAESAAAEHERLAEEIKNKRKKRSKLLGVGIAAIILIVIIIISNIVSALNDPQRAIAKESKALLKQAEEMIDAGNYDSAISILSQISPSWEEYSQTKAPLKTAERGVLMNTISEYQTSGDYEGLIVYIDYHVYDSDMDTEIQAIYNEAVDKTKGNTLSKIATYIENNDYLGAIDYIRSLSSSLKVDTDIIAAFDTAMANYEAEAITKADAFVQAGDYTSARSALSVAQNHIGQTTALRDMVNEINAQEVTEQVLVYAEAENYADAIIYLNEQSAVVSTSTDLQEKQATYIEKYRANVVSNAASEYNANGYEAAISVLNSALKVLPNDENLAIEKSKYENLAPVSLSDLKTFYSDYGYNKSIVPVMEDKLGNTYENCIEYSYGYKDDRDIYVINGEYTTFTGTIFVPSYRSHSSDDWDYEDPFHFSIYGDGELLYYSPKMVSTQYPVDFEVDISGVTELALCWDGGAITWDYAIGLANVWLYKD